MNKEDLIKEAMNMGAVSCRLYLIKSPLREDEVFSRHFFDNNGEEICYFIDSMLSLYGMFKFEIPRMWSDEFKADRNYKLVEYFN